MPVYTYQVVNDDGSLGEVFEVEQAITKPPLARHPETGKKVVRIFDKPNLGVEYTAGKEKALSDITRIKKAGFQILEKDKISGKYFKK